MTKRPARTRTLFNYVVAMLGQLENDPRQRQITRPSHFVLLRQLLKSNFETYLNTTPTLLIASPISFPHISIVNMFRQQQQGGQFPTMNQPYLNTPIHPPASQATNSSRLDQIKQYTGKAEDVLGSLMDPIKPYAPHSFPNGMTGC